MSDTKVRSEFPVVTTEQSFAERLASLMPDQNVSGFARRCGVSPSAMRKYLDGSIPSAIVAKQMADLLGVSLEWLITGRGEMRPTGCDESASQARYIADLSTEFISVPRLDGVLPPIADGTPDQEELGEIIAFRREWLARMGVLPDFARLFVVKGDAMAATLQAGDAILVDTSVDDVEELGIYVIRADDRLMVRRIAPKIDGSLQVMSDNPIYPTEVVTAAEAPGLKIIGQVRWFGRSI